MYAYGSRKSSTSLRRPPSYSDSFIFLDLEPLPSNGRGAGSSEPLSINNPERIPHIPFRPLQTIVSADQLSTLSVPADFSTTEKWVTRFLGFGVHISLVSIFETLFFFLFISKSEDSGLTNVLDGYVGGILASCDTWPANTTALVNDLLSVFINTTQVVASANRAAIERESYNRALKVQAWGYVGGLIGCVTAGALVAHGKKLRIAWRRIVLENLIMVSLLGLYELMFFRTIIYQYENMSLPELDGFVVGQLQAQCGLL